MASGALFSNKIFPLCSDCKSELKVAVSFCPFCGRQASSKVVSLKPVSTTTLTPAPVQPLPRVEPTTAVDEVVSAAVGTERTSSASGDATVAGSRARATREPEKGPRIADPEAVERQAAVPKPKARKWPIYLAGAALAIGLRLMFGGSTHTESKLAPAPSSVQPTVAPQTQPQPAVPKPAETVVAQPPPTAPVIDPSLSTASILPEWRRVEITPDPQRPVILLAAPQPFRLRVNGQLYLVSGAGGTSVDFRGATFMELKSLGGPTQVTITRSAAVERN
jgi:hypothetical protein